jgi:DNA-binding NtrC family response regulator
MDATIDREPSGPISLDDRLRELEASLITWALKVSHGNKSRAAALLQMKRSTLGDRIKHCGLDRTHAAPERHADEGVATL